MDVDVLCVGNASFDLVFAVERHPDADEKCFARGFSEGGGGPAANAAVTVCRLGGSSAFAGYLGDDTFGRLHFEELRSEGVVTDLVVRGEHPTPLSAIIVKPDGKRAVIAHKAATPFLRPGRVDFSRINPRAILFDGHEPDISPELARQAKRRNALTILDAGSVHRGSVELAPLCSCLIASEKFARDFSGEKDPKDALRVLAQTAPTAVITLGEKGLIWASGGSNGRIDAFRVKAVDTTGAGDILHGAFALRAARGEDLVAALRYAGAAAALGCVKRGARAGIPKKEEVERFLRSRLL